MKRVIPWAYWLALALVLLALAGCCAPGTPNHMVPCIPFPLYLFM